MKGQIRQQEHENYNPTNLQLQPDGRFCGRSLTIFTPSRLAHLRFRPDARRRSHLRRMAAMQEATLRKGKVPFLVSLPAPTIRQLVSFHLRATPLAISTRLLGPERSLQPLRTKILLLAQGRYSATPPARPTPPMGYLPYSTILKAVTTQPAGPEALFTNKTGQGQHGDWRPGALFK